MAYGSHLRQVGRGCRRIPPQGSQVYIEGQLRTRKWQDKDQQDRYSTEVVVSMNGVMQCWAVAGGGAPAGQGGQQQFSRGGAPAAAPGTQGQQPQQGAMPDFEDDIPFAPVTPSLTMRSTRCNENKAPSGAFLMRAEVRPSLCSPPQNTTRPGLPHRFT